MKIKSFILTIVLSIIWAISAFAYDEVRLIDQTPTEYEKLTITTSAVSRLNQIYREAAGAVFITVEGNNVRYRIDGGDPDVDDGHLIISGIYQNLWLFANGSIRALRMIAVGGNATVIVTYYRRR